MRLLEIINRVIRIGDYDEKDCIYSIKYGLSPCDIAYILLKISDEFKIDINDSFIDSLENISFEDLEKLVKLEVS